MKRGLIVLLALVVIFSLLAAQCGGPAPTPEKIVETVVVEKVVTQEVEKQVEVVVTQEVEKQVEVVVTPTPEPAPEQAMIMGFPTEIEIEADR